MIKAYLNQDGSLAKYEPQTFKEVILDFDISDTLVNDEQTNEVVKLQDSTQGKRRVAELQSKKELDEFEKQEIKFLSSETQSEKETDKKEVLISWRYLVNITSKGKKKVATIYDSTTSDPNTSIEYDEERGDRWFNTIEEAEAYAKTFNS